MFERFRRRSSPYLFVHLRHFSTNCKATIGHHGSDFRECIAETVRRFKKHGGRRFLSDRSKQSTTLPARCRKKSVGYELVDVEPSY